MDMFTKILNYSSLVIIFIAMIMLAYWVYLIYIPLKIMYIEPPYVRVGSPIYSEAQEITYHIDTYCKYVDARVETHHQLENIDTGDLYVGTSFATGRTSGCYEDIGRSFAIPEVVPPGEYRLNLVSVFYINAFRTEVVNTYSNDFYIL